VLTDCRDGSATELTQSAPIARVALFEYGADEPVAMSATLAVGITTGLYWLFGVSRSNLSTKIDTLATRNQKLAHLVNEQATALRVDEHITEQATIQLQRL
jgi:hypothetical protein